LQEGATRQQHIGRIFLMVELEHLVSTIALREIILLMIMAETETELLKHTRLLMKEVMIFTLTMPMKVPGDLV